MIITIDGPTASGKSTVARELAREYGIYYIASGLLFRALGYLLIKKYNYTPTTVSQATQQEIYTVLHPDTFRYMYDNHGEHVYTNNIEITHLLKSSDIDTASSVVGTNEIARHALLELQRAIAAQHDSIIDGRDCGSVVFPNADFKFFLTASVEVRAQRWQKIQEKLGNIVHVDEAKRCIALRDERDSVRKIAPLIIPKDALVIDSSGMSKDDTIKKIASYIKSKKKEEAF